MIALGVLLLIIGGCAAQKAASHREQGVLLLDEEKLGEAYQEFDKSLEYEDHPAAHAQMGHVQTLHGQFLEAVQHLQLGRPAQGLEKQVALDLATCHENLGAWADAAEEYVRTVELDPSDHRAAVQSEPVWQKLDGDPRLTAWLDRIIRAQPDKHYGWAFAGHHYYRTGNMPQARESYERALEIFPQSLPVRLRLAAVCLKLKDLGAARKEYEAALALRDHPDIRYGLAATLYMMGSFDAALKELEVVWAAEPDHSAAHALATQTCHLKGKDDLALQHGQKALAGQADNAGLLRLVGMLAVLQDARPLGIDACRRLIALDAKDAAAHEMLGELLVRTGELKEARQHLATAVALDPKSFSAHQRLGVVCYRQRDMAAAASELELAVQLNPNCAEALWYLGLINFELGSDTYPEAEKALLRHTELKPDDALGWFYLSLISLDGRRFKEAMDRLQAAADRGFSDVARLKDERFNSVRYGPRFIRIEKLIKANATPPPLDEPPLVPLSGPPAPPTDSGP